MDLFESITELETNPDLHCARLLVLIEAFANDDGKGEIEGITKLAKLDFLLRYPSMLERALVARKKSGVAAEVQPHERNSVESKMVRYRYGPWDHRYWEFLAVLQAKDLIAVKLQGQTRMTGLTQTGLVLARKLKITEEFALVSKRAGLLKSSLDISATSIMRFVYDTFPEVASLQMNKPIES